MAKDNNLTLKRANLDSSWIISFNNVNILLDPWLTGSEVDLFPYFNQQWHVTPPLRLSDLGCKVDIVVISLPFSDHCHEESILLLDQKIPIYAVHDAAKRLRNHKVIGKVRTIIEIPTYYSGHVTFAEQVSFTTIEATGPFDYLHRALLIQPLPFDGTHTPVTGGIFYAPHGFYINLCSPSLVGQLRDMHLEVVMATSTLYSLPFFLGGDVNLGLTKLVQLCHSLDPICIVDTHSEIKKASGLIPLVAVTKYESAAAIRAELGDRYYEMIDSHPLDVTKLKSLRGQSRSSPWPKSTTATISTKATYSLSLGLQAATGAAVIIMVTIALIFSLNRDWK